MKQLENHRPEYFYLQKSRLESKKEKKKKNLSAGVTNKRKNAEWQWGTAPVNAAASEHCIVAETNKNGPILKLLTDEVLPVLRAIQAVNNEKQREMAQDVQSVCVPNWKKSKTYWQNLLKKKK